MKHRILTCKNHTGLRWSCKDIAWSDDHYNHSRNIMFCGIPSGKGMYSDNSGLDCILVSKGKIIQECTCSAKDLIIASEDKLVTC